jgi:O-acetyl-ADP-ribose deacetylase (regulator of RNase III)
MTKGYNLPAKHVIHTVGPIYSKSNAAESQEKLKSAYKNSLTVASKAGLKSVVSRL